MTFAILYELLTTEQLPPVDAARALRNPLFAAYVRKRRGGGPRIVTSQLKRPTS